MSETVYLYIITHGKPHGSNSVPLIYTHRGTISIHPNMTRSKVLDWAIEKHKIPSTNYILLFHLEKESLQ